MRSLRPNWVNDFIPIFEFSALWNFLTVHGKNSSPEPFENPLISPTAKVNLVDHPFSQASPPSPTVYGVQSLALPMQHAMSPTPYQMYQSPGPRMSPAPMVAGESWYSPYDAPLIQDGYAMMRSPMDCGCSHYHAPFVTHTAQQVGEVFAEPIATPPASPHIPPTEEEPFASVGPPEANIPSEH